jgi:hypothetical protein
MDLHDRLTLKLFLPGIKRLMERVDSGESMYKKTGDWNVLVRKYNRIKNEYSEEIKSKDEKIIKIVKEPLNQHKGHGSAKKNQKK